MHLSLSSAPARRFKEKSVIACDREKGGSRRKQAIKDISKNRRRDGTEQATRKMHGDREDSRHISIKTS